MVYLIYKLYLSRFLVAMDIRKEFFRVSIEEIEQALDEILGKNNYDLKKDIKAEEYYQTQRML
ncbi:hypothetical protein ACXO4S_001676 [Campylobacter jejuni]|nr:hypothetical protein [Campylobacter jejuni]EAJ0004362.1 hypothetical protein [Campylobacter coli]EAH8800449.1 hypothetical protein [Campylobacter jejuni]EAJ9164192.1 hypothetical protein [Campylobacter coli]EAJ9205967.1 hypothetical protein [Campylobacter jejuni]